MIVLFSIRSILTVILQNAGRKVVTHITWEDPRQVVWEQWEEQEVWEDLEGWETNWEVVRLA